MELTWTVAIVGWIVALVAGGGGVALIHRIYIRPKVYSKTNLRRLVPQRGDSRHQRAGRTLKKTGAPYGRCRDSVVEWRQANRERYRRRGDRPRRDPRGFGHP